MRWNDRIDRAKRLLIQTDWAMPEITAHCDFNDASRFSAVFRRLTGFSPHAYRQQYRLRG